MLITVSSTDQLELYKELAGSGQDINNSMNLVVLSYVLDSSR